MKDLSRDTILWWREISQRPEFKEGILYLQVNHPYQASRSKYEADLLKSAIAFDAWQSALTDGIDRLTTLPKENRPIESPQLKR